MALFTLEELAAYSQSPLNRATAELVQGLVEDVILGLPGVGPRITDPPQRGIKAIALGVAHRALLNPGNVASESANGTSVSYVTEGSGRGVALTDREISQLSALVGGRRRFGSLAYNDPNLGAYSWTRPFPHGYPP